MNQSALFSLNKQSNANKVRKTSVVPHESSFMRFPFACDFLVRDGAIHPRTHTCICTPPCRFWLFAFPIFHSITHRNSTLDFRFVLISVVARASSDPLSRPGDIFLLFFYYSILSRVSSSLSIPIPVVVFTFITPVDS